MSSERPSPSTRRSSLLNPASIIILCALALTFLGLALLFSATAWFKNKQGIEVPYQYLTKQAIGVVAAGALCFAVSRLNRYQVSRNEWWIAGVCLLLLL